MHLPESSENKSSSFSRDVLTLIKGTTISTVITILASPVITRLYGPEAFGLVALFTSITSILGVVVCLRYEVAIVLPRSDREAANVFGLCMFFVVLISLALVPVFFIGQQSFTQLLKAPHLGPFLWLIPPTLLISGTFLALNYWNTRTKQFHRLSIARVTSSFSTTGTQLAAGFLGYASGSVLIGTSVLGQFVSTFMLGIQIARDHLSFFRQNISRQGMREVFRRYSNFPKYDVWSELINTLSWQIPVFLLAYFFSSTIVGYYSLGMMIITYPMTLIGSSIAQVFLQKAAMAKHEGSLAMIFEDTYSLLLRISLFPLLLLTFIGRDLFIVLFGSSWGEAGYYIQILSVWGVCLFISSPISDILLITGKQKIALILSSINLVTRFLSIYIGGILGSAALAILFFSLSGILVYGVNGIYFMHVAGVKRQTTVKILFSNLLIFLPAGLIMLIAKILAVTGVFEILLATLLFLAYAGYLVKTDVMIRGILTDYKLIKAD